MTSIDLRGVSGSKAGKVELDDAIFGIEPNTAVMHQVVTAQLATRRAGTQSTLTRAEVRGGGAKPWRQKGTGRARQGSIRAPHWRGGGVALGPKPRSYAQRTPKKMVRLALRSALSDRAADGKVVVVDEWAFDAPSTKDAVRALESLEVTGRVLVVVPNRDDAAAKSFRNLPSVHVCPAGELNTYDVLVSDYVVFTQATLPSSEAAASATSTADRGAREEAAAAEATAAPAPAGAATDDVAADDDAAPASGESPTAAAGSDADSELGDEVDEPEDEQ